LTNSNLFCL